MEELKKQVADNTAAIKSTKEKLIEHCVGMEEVQQTLKNHQLLNH